ncbi:hypothetical protein CYMTET_27184 [Cymbomonas tetramitiformis]|uniref:Uncharacterized protein n=1 Tax=Cymbomonas tetramitiformis TaxID=36881 RepID=A0AAE0FQX1_9CHLO|nr:hypothetical protein CYMTET_27184 [Cymbomonas tetramitiformis]
MDHYTRRCISKPSNAKSAQQVLEKSAAEMVKGSTATQRHDSGTFSGNKPKSNGWDALRPKAAKTIPGNSSYLKRNATLVSKSVDEGVQNVQNLPPNIASLDLRGPDATSQILYEQRASQGGNTHRVTPLGEEKKCRLKDLCEEDKAKVAKLIQQVVEAGQEKERFQAEMDETRCSSEERLSKLRLQNQEIISEVASLRSKLGHAFALLRKYQAKVRSMSNAGLSPERDPGSAEAEEGPRAAPKSPSTTWGVPMEISGAGSSDNLAGEDPSGNPKACDDAEPSQSQLQPPSSNALGTGAAVGSDEPPLPPIPTPQAEPRSMLELDSQPLLLQNLSPAEEGNVSAPDGNCGARPAQPPPSRVSVLTVTAGNSTDPEPASLEASSTSGEEVCCQGSPPPIARLRRDQGEQVDVAELDGTAKHDAATQDDRPAGAPSKGHSCAATPGLEATTAGSGAAEEITRCREALCGDASNEPAVLMGLVPAPSESAHVVSKFQLPTRSSLFTTPNPHGVAAVEEPHAAPAPIGGEEGSGDTENVEQIMEDLFARKPCQACPPPAQCAETSQGGAGQPGIPRASGSSAAQAPLRDPSSEKAMVDPSLGKGAVPRNEEDLLDPSLWEGLDIPSPSSSAKINPKPRSGSSALVPRELLPVPSIAPGPAIATAPGLRPSKAENSELMSSLNARASAEFSAWLTEQAERYYATKAGGGPVPDRACPAPLTASWQPSPDSSQGDIEHVEHRSALPMPPRPARLKEGGARPVAMPAGEKRGTTMNSLMLDALNFDQSLLDLVDELETGAAFASSTHSSHVEDSNQHSELAVAPFVETELMALGDVGLHEDHESQQKCRKSARSLVGRGASSAASPTWWQTSVKDCLQENDWVSNILDIEQEEAKCLR